MRSKVVLIKGWWNLAREITLAEFERIYINHVVLIAALRRPQFLPPDMKLDPTTIEVSSKRLVEYWLTIDQDHFLIAEYATVAIDHGGSDIRCVEGEALEVPWFFNAVRSLHRTFGQTIIEAEIVRGKSPNDSMKVKIGDVEYTREATIEKLKPHPLLG